MSTKFALGHPGGPGRPVGTGPLTKIKQHTKEEVTGRFNEITRMTQVELHSLMTDPLTSTMERMIGSICAHAIKTGDPSRLQFLLNYIIGKPKDMDEPEVKDRSAVLDLIPREKLLKLMEKE